MSGILLAGLTDHEAAAIEIMIGMNWRDQRSITLKRGLGLGVPEQNAAARACSSCVVDLFGFGMRRHTPEHEARLMEFLAGRSAVAMVWGNGGAWLERQLKLARGQQVAWVAMPYTSVDMRDALKKIKSAVVYAPAPELQGPVSAPAPTVRLGDRDVAPATDAPVPAWRRAMALADSLKAARPSPVSVPAPAPAPAARRSADATGAVQPPEPVTRRAGERRVPEPAVAPAARPAPALPVRAALRVPQAPAETMPPPPPPMVRVSDDAVGLNRGALQAALEVFPELRSQPLVGLTRKIVSGTGAQLLRVGTDAAFVTHVQQGWLASGLPVSVLLKMLHTPQLVDAITVLPLPADAVEETLRQRFSGNFHRARKPLDVITWELMADMLKGVRLSARGDLTVQLRRFPNFTLLADVGPLDVQLACICARMPQSVADLARAFPRREEDVYRFAVLCILSGLAAVTQPAPSDARASVAEPSALDPVQKQQATARRGFFKSLLDKLF